MNKHESCLQNITEETLITLIRATRDRLVLLAPGISKPLAHEIGILWRRLSPDRVSVILDVDAEVCRLGYGSVEGLAEIQSTATAIGQMICHQPGIRLCVLVSDGKTLIYSPTPLLVEGGSMEPNRPNGFVLETTPSVIAHELGATTSGAESRTIGLDPVLVKKVEEIQDDLKQNPPLQFDIARTLRVFNSKLEFVEFELEGCFVSRRTIPIPAELLGLAKKNPSTRKKLRGSFRLIEPDELLDKKKKVSEESLKKERLRIAQQYLVSIQGFGTVMLRANKDSFLKEVEGLRKTVGAFREALAEKLESIFSRNAEELTKALLPSVAKNPPPAWLRFLGPVPNRTEIKDTLHRTLLEAFGPPEALLSAMKVNVVFKGVTYETLSDQDFVALAEKAFPKIILHEEFDAAKGAPPEQQELFGA